MQRHTRNRSNSTFKRVALEPIYRTRPFLLFLTLSLSLFYGHAIVIDRLPRKCLLTVRARIFLGKACGYFKGLQANVLSRSVDLHLEKASVFPRDNCKAQILIKIVRTNSKLIALFFIGLRAHVIFFILNYKQTASHDL